MKEYIYTLDFLHEHNTAMCLNLHNSKGIVVTNVHKDSKSGYTFDYDNKTWHTRYRWALIENTPANMFIYNLVLEEQHKISQARDKYQELLGLITSTEIQEY